MFTTTSTAANRDATGPAAGGFRDGILAYLAMRAAAQAAKFDPELAPLAEMFVNEYGPIALALLVGVLTLARKWVQEKLAASRRPLDQAQKALVVLLAGVSMLSCVAPATAPPGAGVSAETRYWQALSTWNEAERSWLRLLTIDNMRVRSGERALLSQQLRDSVRVTSREAHALALSLEPMVGDDDPMPEAYQLITQLESLALQVSIIVAEQEEKH